MARITLWQGWPLLLVALTVGCTGSTSSTPSPAQDESKVKAAFEDVQKALKAKDADKIWGLLDSTSQKDADRAAKAWQDKLAKAEPDQIKKDLGISAEELPKLTGKSFLKTEAFFEKEIDELAKSTKIETIKVEGDKATVSYKDPKGETDKVAFARQDGQWKVRLSMEMPK
jgi:hypothetical protein